MNFVRMIVGQGGHAPKPQDQTLYLTHLKKLFSEIKQPNNGLDQKEIEDKIYNMLPLFCKVFGGVASVEMTEKFGDILQFCNQVSRLMVSEIRRRASNLSPETASHHIAKFLEIDTTEETSNGWMLLSTINLLASGNNSLIDCMTAASLPSTLVKCLYLFFDLPAPPGEEKHEVHASSYTPYERRVLLQKMFVQVLVRLCSHKAPAEELVRKEDLTLLFSAITSWCAQHNVPWRKSAAEVLMTLSRHGLTPNVVQYIHSKGCVYLCLSSLEKYIESIENRDKGCVALCVDNMQRVQELSPIELVEMFVTVFCFLKDSSEVSQTLLDDFRACQGYSFLTDFLLRMEKDSNEESIQALRNLVLLVGSLTTCGYIELKPTNAAASGSLFKLPGFTVPQPAGTGVSVRNLHAFQVLQQVFLKGTSSHLCSTILDVISSIYHQDNANYFILEPQNTLSQFAERIHLKPVIIQTKFFDMLEFVVFNLNFVPCKELISITILIKSNHSIQTNQLCMRSLLKLLRHHVIFKDVFRDVGILEVMVTCLHRFATLLKEPHSGEATCIENLAQSELEMGDLVIEGLVQLLSGNAENASVFRESGGARCAHNMVPYELCRQQALTLVQQLVLSPGGDDDMGTLLGLMHTAPPTQLLLKTHILKSLLTVLRESHRTRTVFRKVGGFVYVMSVLVSMEGCLADPPRPPWDTVSREDVLTLLKMVFSTLTVAMRYEPANARFFATEVRFASLTDAVRLLGCFTREGIIPETISGEPTPKDESPFNDYFYSLDENKVKEIPLCLISSCLMLRYLYDMALDHFEKPSHATGLLHDKSPRPSRDEPANHVPVHVKRMSSLLETATSEKLEKPSGEYLQQKRASTGSLVLTLTATHPDPLIVHPGAVIAILHLIPTISVDVHDKLALDLEFFACELVKSLLRTERNQQVMCEAGLPSELLSTCVNTLANEKHPLHVPLQYVFERLAAQSLTPKDLRDFLRLGSPLCCTAEDEESHDIRRQQDAICAPNTFAVDKPLNLVDRKNQDISKKLRTNGGAVPLTRVKCLVSMTTPRDVRLHGTSITPAFVEFDMTSEGFGCLYLPSISPQGPPNPSVVSAGMISGGDSTVVGGIGQGERLFPPQSGFTFCSWLCVDKFSGNSDAHPVRLLTIVRHIQGRDDGSVCLNVYIAPRDRSLIVSTQEMNLPISGTAEHELDQPSDTETMVRFWCPELTQEGQWCHLVLLFHRAGIYKNSSVGLFIDGQHVATRKLHYISPNLGSGGTASASATTSSYAYLGTPPQLRRVSKLVWRQGPCYMFEDIVQHATISQIHSLGPNYVGSFQACENADGPLVQEEKIVFGVHAHAMSLMTVAKIRNVYNRTDARSVAKQLGMPNRENATPIRILHNSAAHLSGPARSFGAILMGYLGVRTFCPRPVAKMIVCVGGPVALLGLIAMATDVEGLYASVKALVCVTKSNQRAQKEMQRIRGYQTLGMLFKKKRSLLNSHILHLTFSLVGTVDSGRETTVIPNKIAFEDLLCDLEIWHEAPHDLQKSLHEHFYELLTESSEQKANLKLMLNLGLDTKLLHILKDPSITRGSLEVVCGVLLVMVRNSGSSRSLQRFAHFMVSLIPSQTCNEKTICLEETVDTNATNSRERSQSSPSESSTGSSYDVSSVTYNIKLRNACLGVLDMLMCPPNHGFSSTFADEMQRVLGFDWLMLFLQRNVHHSTVIIVVKMLVTCIRNQGLQNKFREGTTNGGWMKETEEMLKNKGGKLLGFHVGGAVSKLDQHEINKDICLVPGFSQLQWYLPQHAEISELYLLLMSLLLAIPVNDLPKEKEFTLNSMCRFLFGEKPSSAPAHAQRKHELCGEAAVCVLAMIRSMLNQQWETGEEGSWLREYPVTLIQFLLYLYHHHNAFTQLCLGGGDILASLAATLFPYRQTTSESADDCTPLEEYKPFPNADPLLVVKPQEKGMNSLGLTSHAARKHVMDFLKLLVMDSLTLPSSSKSPAIIDQVLEASPEQASRTQRREYQTEVLCMLMTHLSDADVLLSDQAALRVVKGGNLSNIPGNVFYFAGRVVDKLWHDDYVRETKEIFEFICALISQAKRKASGPSIDSLYKCLTRTVLYQLSRPLYSVADMMSVVYALHKLTEHRNLIFGPGNYDQEFLGCLCYCLLQLTADPSHISNPPHLRQTTWHFDLNQSNASAPGDGAAMTDAEKAKYEEGQQLLCQAAKRVWEELYLSKRQALEDLFKTSLSNPDTSDTATPNPDISRVRSLIQDQAAKMWCTYFENEKKCVYGASEKLRNQLQTKIQKVGSNVFKMATRRAIKETPVKVSYTSPQTFISWVTIHSTIVRDLVDRQFQQYFMANRSMEKYLTDEWSQVEADLMKERGLWGPPVASELEKQLLDMTEGPHRMRKKMIKNDMFYIHYPYRPPEICPNGDMKQPKFKMPISLDSQKFYERYRSHSLIGNENNLLDLTAEELQELSQNIQQDSHEPSESEQAYGDEMPINTPSLLPRLQKQSSENKAAAANENEDDTDLDLSVNPEGGANFGEGGASGEQGAEQNEESNKTDNQTLLRLLEEGDKISHMFRCARIQGLDTVEGLLLFGKEHFYIVDNFTLLKSKEIADIDSLPEEGPLMPYDAVQIGDMHEPIIPPTSRGPKSTQKNKCFKFNYEDIREVHKRRYLLQPMGLEIFSSDGRNFLLAFPKKEIRNKVLTRFLTVATSIADNAQSISGQRAGAKVEPGTGLIHSLIGEKSVTERWLRGEISNFEYLMCLNTLAGRSYNDLMQYPVFPWIVADYKSEELDLNNGKTFRDLSKPMGAQTEKRLEQFKKRYNDWEDPQGETPPYHYGTHYSSAMIVASYLVRMEPFSQHFLRLQGGHFDLADRMFHSVGDAYMSASQNNMADVKELIPEFFYLPEFLLNENNFDLGVKQSQVKLGDVVLPVWAKNDPREFIRAHREALECDYVSAHLHEWIDLIFGQRQQGDLAVDSVNVFHYLFYEGNVDINNIEDPLQKTAIIGFINNFGQIPKQLFKRPHPQKRLNIKHMFFHSLENLRPAMQPVKEVRSAVGQIIQHENKVLAVEQNKVLIPPVYNKYLAWGFSDMSMRIGNYDSEKATSVFENLDTGELMCATCPNSKLVITAGTSTVVNVWEFGKGRDKKSLHLKMPLYGHTDSVTCLAASSGYNLIVSGSRDRTCIIWDLSRLCFVRQLRGHAAPVATVCINELTGDIATCAGTYLHVWSINGVELASINTATTRMQQISCVAMSQMMEWDPKNVIITGSTDGVVRMWSLEFVEVAEESYTPEQRERLKSASNSDVLGNQDESETKRCIRYPSEPPGQHRKNSAFQRIPKYQGEDIRSQVQMDSSVESDNPFDAVRDRFRDPKSAALMNNDKQDDLISLDDDAFEDEDDDVIIDTKLTRSLAREGSNVSNGKEPSIDSCMDALDHVMTSSTTGNDVTNDVTNTNNQSAHQSSNQQNQSSQQQQNNTSTSQQSPINSKQLNTERQSSDGFEVVSTNDVTSAISSERNAALQSLLGSALQTRPKRKLRPGFCWQKQLVFRYKLTMHTAFERKDNKDPAPVTALAISKDHKLVYVGDAKGRVWSWAVSEQQGKFVDHWIRDEGTDSCTSCRTRFSLTERRHHCRNCGQLFCSKCSRFETEIKRLRIFKPVRVCQACYNLIKANQASEAMSPVAYL